MKRTLENASKKVDPPNKKKQERNRNAQAGFNMQGPSQQLKVQATQPFAVRAKAQTYGSANNKHEIKLNPRVGTSLVQRDEQLAEHFAEHFADAYRADVMSSRQHFMQEAEGTAIARELKVKARVMKDDPNVKGLIHDQCIPYGDGGKEGTLLHVNNNHYIVIEPIDGNSKGEYNDSSQKQYKKIYDTISNGNCLIDGLYYIKYKETVPPDEAARLRVHAATNISNEQIAAIRPTLAEMALSGKLTGVGPRTKAFFDRLRTPRTRTEPVSESESDSEIDNLWNDVSSRKPQRNKTKKKGNVLSETDAALLADLNKQIRTVKSTKDIKAILKHEEYRKFVVAQYRGITYMTNRFPTDARRKHRKSRPIGVPIYPDALRGERQAYHDFYMMAARGDEELYKKLAELEKWFIEAQQISPFYDKSRERLFASMQHYFQGQYSQKYAKSLALIWYYYLKQLGRDREIKHKPETNAETDYVYGNIPFHSHPYVSTSDTPRHAVRYALGNKAIKSENEFRLRPRWSETGRPAHPYTGTVSVSFHPLRDYLSPYAPSHVFSARKLGTVMIDNRISREAESSFLAIKPKRVVLALPVRWPSLRAEDDESRWFGLTESKRREYRSWLADPQKAGKTNVQTALESAVRKPTEDFLVKAIARAVKAEAKRRNKIVVYRGVDGDFVTEPPIYSGPDDATKDFWRVPRSAVPEGAPPAQFSEKIAKITSGEQRTGHLITGYSPVGFPRPRFYRQLSNASNAAQSEAVDPNRSTSTTS